MENSKIKIAFFGSNFGEILKEKLQKAGFLLVDMKIQQADLIVVGFYGTILPKKILEVPQYGSLNVHPSLLPKYRGPTPVQTAILNNEATTGVTIILMDEKADHGPILASHEFSISHFQFLNGCGKPNTPELTKALWELGGDLLVKTIPEWIAGRIEPTPQDHSKATYTKFFKREDGRIDWNNNPEYIERQVRAYYPWPGAFTFWKGKRVKLLKAHLQEGKLVVDELQLEGKKSMTLREFLLGHPLFKAGD